VQRRQVCRARRGVALANPEVERQLTLHRRVALSSLLIDNLPEVSAWARRVLGDLMRDDEPTARLRETVQTFLDTRQRQPRRGPSVIRTPCAIACTGSRNAPVISAWLGHAETC
jgi:hypothetical protein